MPITDLFASPKRRLARAGNHIDNIESSIRAFLETQPYARAVECNAQRWEEHKLKLTRPIPDDITDFTYEAIEALRSSLDQAIHVVALACGAKNIERLHFPVADSPAYFNSEIGKWLRDFPPDIIALFRSFESYQGGNGEIIWALNRIR